MPNLEAAASFEKGFVSKSFYQIGKRRLSFETDAGWCARFTRNFVSGFRLTPSPANHFNNIDFRFTVRLAPPPPLPKGLESFPLPGGVCHHDSEQYFLDVRGARIHVAPSADQQLAIWLGRSEGHSRSSLITVFAYALPAALRRCGFYDLHAAGLMDRNNRGFIFAGSSESGKTSLAIRLGSLGWEYLSDDSLLLSETDNEIEMLPFRRPFQTDAETLAGVNLTRIDEALGVTIPHDPKKRKLDPEVLFPRQFRAIANPSVLCFPSITHERQSRLIAIGPAEAMTRLIRMCPWATYDKSSASQHLGLLARLVQKCKVYSLYAGLDIFDEPAALGELLEGA